MSTIDPVIIKPEAPYTEAPAFWNTSYITPEGYVCRIPLIDVTGGVSIPSQRRRSRMEKIKVNDMFSQVRQLHEQINTYLHSVLLPSVLSFTAPPMLLMPFISHLDHEELWTMLLSRRNSVNQLVRLYQGSVNSSQVRVGEVFRQAIVEQSSAT